MSEIGGETPGVPGQPPRVSMGREPGSEAAIPPRIPVESEERSPQIRQDIDPQVKPYLPRFMRRLHEIRPPGVTEEEFNAELGPLYDRYLIDHGLQRPASVMVGRDTYTAPPVHMLGRSGVITHLEEMHREFSPEDFNGNPENPPGIHLALLDVESLRLMNYAEAGNYGLNLVAGKLQEKVDAINSALRAAHGGELSVGRIGGDEFMVTFFGMSSDKAKEFYDQITNPNDGVTSLESFYKDTEDPNGTIEPERRKIGLKEEPFITIPTEPDRARVMWSYLHKGVILEPQHIDRILELEQQGFTNPEPAEFQGTVQERLDRIVESHPELLETTHNVENWMGRAEAAGGTYTREEGMKDYVDFVEGVVYDRLLGENVRPLTDLNTHVATGDVSEMWVYDMSIKEINDYAGLFYGDAAIQATFGAAQDVVRRPVGNEGDDTDKVMYFRRGGTIVVAARRDNRRGGSALPEEKRQQLNALQSVNMAANGGEAQFDLGFAHDVLVNVSDRDEVAIAGATGEVLRRAQHDWYGKMVDAVIRQMRQPGSETLMQEILGSPNDERPPNVDSLAPLSDQKELLRRFFHGKRRKERLKTLVDVIRPNVANYLQPRPGMTDADIANSTRAISAILAKGVEEL